MSKKVLASALSPYAARLRISALLKGVDVSFELPPGGSGSAELRQLTPFGRIPAMLEDDAVLVESLALLEYIEDTHPGTRSLRPDNALALARVRMISLLFDHNVIKALHGVFVQLLSPKPDADAARKAFDEVEAELAKLVHFFDPEGPSVANQWTIADCAMAPFAFLMDLLAPVFGVVSPTQRVPRFKSWWQEAGALPEVGQVTEGMRQAFAAMAAAKKSQG